MVKLRYFLSCLVFTTAVYLLYTEGLQKGGINYTVILLPLAGLIAPMPASYSIKQTFGTLSSSLSAFSGFAAFLIVGSMLMVIDDANRSQVLGILFFIAGVWSWGILILTHRYVEVRNRSGKET